MQQIKLEGAIVVSTWSAFNSPMVKTQDWLGNNLRSNNVNHHGERNNLRTGQKKHMQQLIPIGATDQGVCFSSCLCQLSFKIEIR